MACNINVLVALLAFFRFERIFIDDVYAAIWNFRIFNLIGILTLLAYLRFTYYLVYNKLPKSFLILSAIGITIFIWFLVSPIAAIDILTILFLIIIVEMLRVISISLIKKRTLLYDDSWIILIGILPFTVTSIHRFMTRLGVVPELWDFISFPYTYYSLLVVLLSMSVFLARNFAKTNKDLEIQLEQVKSLSEKTLQQEIEKKSSAWSKEKKGEKIRELQLGQREMQIKSEDAKMELKQLQDKELEPILKMLQTVVSSYGEKNGFSVILDSKVAVLYADSSIEVSEDVKKELDKRMK